MQLLKDLCELFGPSGDELAVRDFLINYVKKESRNWNVKPQMLYGEEFQNCLMLVFGNPRTAIFAHMDTVGFTVRYEDQLVPVGSPEAETGYTLVGSDELGPIECRLIVDEENRVKYKFGRPIKTGTQLVYKCDFKETNDTIQSCYLDNRLGIYTMLKLAGTLENGIIAFSCWEEHGGGSISYLIKYIYEKYKVRQALIADITWVTDGIKPSEGVVISMRDHNIPRRAFIDKIIAIAGDSDIPYQLEVEAHGSSDGKEVQLAPYPVDWCFIGAPEENNHSPHELVHKKDIYSMVRLYEVLMRSL